MAEQSLFSSGELEFLHTVELLKTTDRAGWKKPGRDIKAPESVSDHSYRMIVMAMMSEQFDRMKVMRLVAIHDLGESIVGDITPSDGIDKDEKYFREELAFEYLQCLLVDKNPKFAHEIMALWKEFDNGLTPEAKRARELDAFECLLQVDEYEERFKKNLDDFRELEKRITSPDIRDLLISLKSEKQARRARQDSIDLTIFVIGGPGIGKGTVCTQLVRDFDFHHISVGDLLREEAKPPDETKPRESTFAKFITKSMKHSVILPPQLTISLLRKAMGKASTEGKTKFLIDGFPRSVDQASMFEQKVRGGNYTLLLNSTEGVMRARLEQRAASSDRVDDNPESIIRRFRTFQTQNPLVENYLREHGFVETVESVGSVDQVYQLVKPVVEKMIRQVENSH